MKFRVLILNDPYAEARGFSIRGVKVPLRTWAPIDWNEDIATFNGKKLDKGLHTRFWKLSCDDMIESNPRLEKHLKRHHWLLVPVEHCDVSPVERWDECWGNWDNPPK